MNIAEYVQENWSDLPKSTFNSERVVIVKQITNEDYGYGHHYYEGYGVTESGDLVWCYSSGCSCNGSCGMDHKFTAKSFHIEWPDEFSSIDPKETSFSAMSVDFSDY